LAVGVAEYTEDYQAPEGHQHATVVEADLTAPGLRLNVVDAGDVAFDPSDETVSSMANRTKAVAGINGDYFDVKRSGAPSGGAVSGGVLVKSPRPNYNGQLEIGPDRRAHIGAESYTASITDVTDSSSHALTSVNTITDANSGGITEITSRIGRAASSPATYVSGTLRGDTMTVSSVQGGVSGVPRPATGGVGLLGTGAGGQWLADSVHPGDTVLLRHRLAPVVDPHALLSGATVLARGGALYNDPTGMPPSGVNPETAVGISDDGWHLIMVTIDGRAGAGVAVGVTPTQTGQYLLAHGATDALLLDGGGSTELVARDPGAATVSVRNTPSQGYERPIADGLFLYSSN
ncbi:MAG: phosphodiester glycosidase family protein, partial [Sciscionella sp.]|nr:phosphodiester glycosidase family protein [Sciscionella sp.]